MRISRGQEIEPGGPDFACGYVAASAATLNRLRRQFAERVEGGDALVADVVTL